jgi:ParB family chromosome partitioning protein
MVATKDRKKLSSFTFEGERANIPLSQIHLPSYQPRNYFAPEKLEELARTIKCHGIVEPLVIRPKPLSNFYELVAGGRRYRAAQLAGLTEVPVTILELTDSEALEVAMLENLQREDLNPIEETEGILHLLAGRLSIKVEEVPALLYKLNRQSQGQIKSDNNVIIDSDIEKIVGLFDSLGKFTFQSFVQNRLPLLNLPQEILSALREGKIAYTKARAIAKVEDAQTRKNLLDETIHQNLSLSQIQEKIRQVPNLAIEKPITAEQRAKATFQRVTKFRPWNDPKKQKKFEELLEQLEALMSD